jgi:hypothetical protein
MSQLSDTFLLFVSSKCGAAKHLESNANRLQMAEFLLFIIFPQIHILTSEERKKKKKENGKVIPALN